MLQVLPADHRRSYHGTQGRDSLASGGGAVTGLTDNGGGAVTRLSDSCQEALMLTEPGGHQPRFQPEQECRLEPGDACFLYDGGLPFNLVRSVLHGEDSNADASHTREQLTVAHPIPVVNLCLPLTCMGGVGDRPFSDFWSID